MPAHTAVGRIWLHLRVGTTKISTLRRMPFLVSSVECLETREAGGQEHNLWIVGAERDLVPLSFSESFQAEEEEGPGGTWAETIHDHLDLKQQKEVTTPRKSWGEEWGRCEELHLNTQGERASLSGFCLPQKENLQFSKSSSNSSLYCMVFYVLLVAFLFNCITHHFPGDYGTLQTKTINTPSHLHT